MVRSRKKRDYRGLLVIGDPHVESRQPGFRKDDFPHVILDKIQWCLDYAREQKLLPTFLGDIFDKPRDNHTWIIGELLEMMLAYPSIGIYGNHDCAETELNEHDSLSILIKSGCFRLVEPGNVWSGEFEGRRVVVGGSCYRQTIPKEFDISIVPSETLFDEAPRVVWLTHHDIDFAGYESGRFKPFEIKNVDLLINGHIHRRLDSIPAGDTLWMNPGNISRRSRSEAIRSHIPKVLEITFNDSSYEIKDVIVPHKPFDEVFHEAIVTTPGEESSSGFVSGLREMNERRTQSGAGLHEFLKQNLDQFQPEIAQHIQSLADEVTANEETVHV